ncbi:MAG: hypothetical protein GC191_09135 [Azospirillum sp.]|nr:hypothetical protein [Azospirillum sp.]
MTADLPSIDAPAALRNILQQLQAEPQRYKLFGIYWWPVKALLRRAGYGPDQLYMLGRYHDPVTGAMVPPLGLTAMLEAAFEEYGRNARYPHADGLVENPDGELVTVFDEDAGF